MQCLPQPDSWSPVSEGFVGDPWLSILLTLCYTLHSVSHWPVFIYFINQFGYGRLTAAAAAFTATPAAWFAVS
jgi:hypothetical protein